TAVLFGANANKVKMRSVSELDIFEEEASPPCADFKIGDDDLQAFDFIRQFSLDIETGHPGVSQTYTEDRLAHHTNHRFGIKTAVYHLVKS
ncbi:collagen alpha-3(IX) chain-like, partial [Asbolus verrucosus]